ncbi:hypothetical protein COCMIDRAFT_32689 [Bipolaris oryzae ATCC 44560]|uniref:Uncharacterized protein n=1 Tax=Bipolaris oryzae ATCC 44560 TaxID=930090 RepID=W7A1I5_COCMI|nr:uncharacterized protein COCMIDRAFT_32689 [Bipolaris oryzae ATCC 44560]EUC49891.1 hypothetical protein COCMIDRAFT_32689 [Bipolaris oryzae ATCC 44560]
MALQPTATAAAYAPDRLDLCWAVEKKQTVLTTHATPMAPCILASRETNYLEQETGWRAINTTSLVEGLIMMPRYVRTNWRENGPPQLACLHHRTGLSSKRLYPLDLVVTSAKVV